VLFIGGGTGGGKTTLARALAAKHGLRTLYPAS
jgi:adenylate kinase family enzyme